jgi:hypothetical protein
MPAAAIDHGIDNISSVAGRYVLGARAHRPGVNILACRLRAISPNEFAATAPAVGPVGEAVSASFGPFGALRGHISRHLADGFVVELDRMGEGQNALAKRIEAFRNRPWRHGMADRRAAKRYMPAEPRSMLIVEPGIAMPCLVVDYSATGAVVSANTHPEVGAPVTVGHMLAHVVRLFDAGFAVRFDHTQPDDDIEAMLETPRGWREAMAVVTPMRIDTHEPGDPTADGYGYD